MAKKLLVIFVLFVSSTLSCMESGINSQIEQNTDQASGTERLSGPHSFLQTMAHRITTRFSSTLRRNQAQEHRPDHQKLPILRTGLPIGRFGYYIADERVEDNENAALAKEIVNAYRFDAKKLEGILNGDLPFSVDNFINSRVDSQRTHGSRIGYCNDPYIIMTLLVVIAPVILSELCMHL